jgi:hypothetical protein
MVGLGLSRKINDNKYVNLIFNSSVGTKTY